MKEQLIQWLKANYTEEQIDTNIDATIPEYIDDDWEDDYESEYEAYQETGRGEAEDQVRMEIERHAKEALNITNESYQEDTDEEICETIISVFTKLDT